jgi:MerR family transcriptional regulator, thiopeptide resistance regulator
MVEDRPHEGQAMSYSVSQIARLAGVSVRTLHHYDQIGLLSPADRSGAGYRRYRDDDLRRLQQILFYRELGFALSDITELVSEPGAEPAEHLRRQRELLAARLERTRRLIQAVETAMEAEKMGISLTPQERLEVFGSHDPDQYADEAEARWGETEAYRESRHRTRSYTKQDWLTIKIESDQIVSAFAAAKAAGQAPGSAAAMDAAEQHRQHISRWFYDCPAGMHRGLAEMYVADERFAASYEPIAPGLAAYIRDAIVANAERVGS